MKEPERFPCELTDLSPLLWCLRIVLGNRQYFLIEKDLKLKWTKFESVPWQFDDITQMIDKLTSQCFLQSLFIWTRGLFILQIV